MQVEQAQPTAFEFRPAEGWSLWRRRVGRWPVFPVLVLSIITFCAIFADFITDQNPIIGDLKVRRAPPMWMDGGSSEHILGGDLQGRDVLTRIIHGTRVSLLVAASVILFSTTFGTLYGMTSGFIGGWVDEIMMRIVEVFLSVPSIMVAMIVIVIVGQGRWTVVAVLTLFAWMDNARLTRSETLVLKQLDYVSFARVAGASHARLIIRHIFPGVVNTMVVLVTLSVGGVILSESVLSFLGVGIPPPTPAWGLMVSEGRSYLTSSWWIAIFPGIAIFFTVIAFNFLGDWIRDTLDPRLRQVE